MIVHSNDRPHVCEICGRGFKRSDHMKAHYKTVHGDTPKRNDAVSSLPPPLE